MKKIITVIIFSLLIICLCACGTNDIKHNIFDIVEKNEDVLIEAINTGEYEKIYAIGIKDITVNDDYIVFYYTGRGIAPSSQEYGFYYSVENKPIAIFDGHPVCNPEEMTEKENGYEYIDNSYNSFYTEKVIEHFYYYDNNL